MQLKNYFTLNSYNSQQALKLIFFPLFALQALIVLFIALWSTKLRPISDDYCFASAAGEGVFPALQEYFLTWSGEIASVFYSLLFIGWPIVNLPWSMGSSITFILAGIIVGCISLWILFESCNILLKKNVKVASFFVIFFSNIWWASWWLTTSLGIENDSLNFLAHSITFWQNINTAYVMTTSLSVLCLFSLKHIQNRSLLPIAFILGLATGFSGIVLGASFFVLSMFLTIALLFMLNHRNRLEHYGYAIFTLGSLVSVIISYLSPGTQNRKEIDGSEFTLTELISLEVINRILSNAFVEYFSSILNLNNLLIFISFFTLFILFGSIFKKLNIALVKFRIIQISLLVIIFSIANKSAELFNYPAIWHTIPLYLFNYFIILYLSIYLSSLIVEKDFLNFYKSILFTIVISQLIVIFSISFMINKIDERLLAWNKGSAPIAGIGDLFEDPNHWINKCWIDIGKFRDLPDRQ